MASTLGLNGEMGIILKQFLTGAGKVNGFGQAQALFYADIIAPFMLMT